MSEESLRRFLERFNSDTTFRETAQNDPETALADFDLSPAERAALAWQDEDGLRRLLGEDTAGFMGIKLIVTGGCKPRTARPKPEPGPQCHPTDLWCYF